MNGDVKIYLDTNVFIYATEYADERRTLLVDLFLSGLSFITSSITLAELVDKPHQLRQDRFIDIYRANITNSSWLTVVPADEAIAYYAGVLKSGRKGLKPPYALHLSTAIGMGCSHFLTGDLGITGPFVVDHIRYGITRTSSPLTIIRPDISTLDTLLKSLEQ